MNITERIFYLLESQGKTAKELSEYIGIKPSSITGWKNEGSYPSSKLIIRISEFFNVSIEYLFTGKDYLGESIEKDQVELLQNYSSLDNRGKHRVHTVIYEELDRIASQHEEKEAKSAG